MQIFNNWLYKSKLGLPTSTKILVLLTTIILIGYLIFQSDFLSKDKPFITSDLPSYRSENPNVPIKVEFDYTVSQISDEQILLTGEKGDFILPNDESVVVVHQGNSTDSPTVTLSSLKVGDTLNLEFIPNQSAKLFLIETNLNEI